MLLLGSRFGPPQSCRGVPTERSTQVIAMASRARGLVEAVHPGLPGEWCLLAAELAGAAGEHADAVGLLCGAARRALDAGALTTAGQLLDRAGVHRPEAAELRVEVAARRGDMDAATAAGAPRASPRPCW